MSTNTQTNEQLTAYYVSLLLQQYSGQTSPQTITFTGVPAAGNFTLTFGALTVGGNGLTGGLAWNSTNAQVSSAFTGSVYSPSSDPNNPQTYLATFPYTVAVTGNPLSTVAILFPATPASGTFKLTYGANSTTALSWNASAATIQTALQLVSGLSGAIVSGSIAAGAGLLIQTNDAGPGQCLCVTANSLVDASSNAITPTTASTMSFDFGNNTPLITGCTLNTLTDINGASVSVVTSGDLVKATMTIQAFAQLNVMNQLPAIIQDAYNLIPTVQIITFSAAPPSGTFEISLAVTSTPSISTTSTAAINWNDSNQTVTNKINAILPSGYVTLGGSLASGILILSFTNVNPTVLSIVANSTGETTTIDTNLAYGAQLDVLAKYAGVKRNGNGPSGAVTLSDSDLYTLIQLGIITNNFGSSLADIDNLLFTFFQGNIRVFDNQQMQLAYTVNGAYFSNALLDCIISQGLFPKPMGVQLAGIILGTEFFAFCDAQIPTNRTGYGFNDAQAYALNTPWLSATDTI